MNFQMKFQFILACEHFTTIVAAEWLFSRMYKVVIDQITFGF